MPSPDPGSSPSPSNLPAPIPNADRPSGPRPALAPVVLAADPTAANGLNVLTLLQALRRRWLTALVVALPCAAAAAAAAWFLLPPSKFVVRATLEVPVNPPSVPGQPVTPVDFLTLQRRLTSLVKSKAVLFPVLADAKVKELATVREKKDPLLWLERELKADFARGPELLGISLGGDDPEDLLVLVDVIADVARNETLSRERKDKQGRLDTLQTQFDRKNNELRDLQEAHLKLVEKVGNDKIAENTHKHELDKLLLLEKERIDIESKLRALGSRLTVLKARESGVAFLVFDAADVDERVEREESVQKHLARISELEEAIKLNKGFRPDVARSFGQREQNALAEEKKELAAARLKARPLVVDRMQKDARSRLRSDVAEVKGQIEELAEQKKQLDKEIAKLGETPTRIARNSDAARVLQLQIATTQQTVQDLARTMERLRVELDAEPRVRGFESASVVELKDDKKQHKMAGLGAAGGFLLAVFAVSFWEYRCQRINSVDQVVRGLEMTVMGTLPLGHGSRRLRARRARTDPLGHTLLTESIDATRTMLLHAARARSLHVVMVTSATSGEGKTSVSCHLAASLARAGRKTLLVDCDLRRPAVHRLFNLEPGPGFSEVLRGEVEVAGATQQTGIAGLSVMPAGRGDAHTIQALARDDVRAVFDRLSGLYDFIIVDSAPVLPVADSLLIGQHVDAVLISILSDVSTMPKVHTAAQRLTMLGINVLGAVVNGAEGETYGYGYGYGNRLISASA